MILWVVIIKSQSCAGEPANKLQGGTQVGHDSSLIFGASLLMCIDAVWEIELPFFSFPHIFGFDKEIKP